MWKVSLSFTVVVISLVLWVPSGLLSQRDQFNAFTKVNAEWAANRPSSPVSSLLLPIMTFNIRGENLDSGLHAWTNRRPLVAETILKYRPVVIGTQEGSFSQIVSLQQSLPGYKIVQNGNQPSVAMLYDASKVELVHQDLFWLSENPQVANSISWGASMPRKALHAKFKLMESGMEFIVLNVHMDHVSEEARRRGAQLIKDSIEKLYPNGTVFLIGDFNAAPGHFAHDLLTHGSGSLEDSWVTCVASDSCYTNNVASSFEHWWGDQVDSRLLIRAFQFAAFTWHGKELPSWNRYHIDWILYKSRLGNVNPLLVAVETTEDTNKLPSDHFPVIALFNVTLPTQS